MTGFTVQGRRIGPDADPFIIAEVSGNHNGSLDRAVAIIRAIADAGADCVKFQTYTADTITLDAATDDFLIRDPDSLWHRRRLHELYDEAHTPWDWHAALFEEARKAGLIAFSSPFDETAVDFLEALGAPMYKIASFELTHLPLIRKAAATGRPMILSTGMAHEDDIALALDTARAAGAKDLAILKCTSAYPADASDAHLRTIPDMRRRFGVEVGLSDHTLGIGVAVASVALGASLIEKHVTLSRADGGVDAAFSLEPAELRLLKDETRRARAALGAIRYGGADREQASRAFRPSIWPSRPIARGEILSADNLIIRRPGQSLAPVHLDALLGAPAPRDLGFAERLTEADLSAIAAERTRGAA